MIFNRLVRICGLAIILICYLLISCGPLPEEQAVTSISPTTATASDTQVPTVVPTPNRSLPEEILMAIKNGVQSSDDFSSQLDNDWYFSAEYVKREGENVHVYGGGNWEGDILNTEAVRSGVPIWNINAFAEEFLRMLPDYKDEVLEICIKVRSDRD